MSKWQSHPTDTIPEMTLEVLSGVMKQHFDVLSEPVAGKPYAIRLIGSPYNAFVPDCRSIQVMTHNRGTSPALVSPHNIKRILAKFDIPEDDFLISISNIQKPPSAPTVGKDVKPN
jgi:hypothetical protein